MASLYSFVCYHHLLLFLLAAAITAALTTRAVADDMTHLHFYMHDILGGSNPTAVEIVKAPSRCLPSPHQLRVVSVQGRDPIAAPVRELSVVGGTGQFRMAHGYVLWKTHGVNDTNDEAILELDVYLTAQ
uniref:Dirigent protein n=1 Tax=Ananas comosus var. bracteatus TaxID=296719 RepID=A0A6V7P1A4_ANACO|nr:unnamed protein product [Ananas comosus var. bracteatus]